jgi:hypothetical protein
MGTNRATGSLFNRNPTVSYFLFWLESDWLIIQTERPLSEAEKFAKTFDEFATFTDSYFLEDVEEFNEPYRLISF